MVIGVVVDNEFDHDVRVQNEVQVIGKLGLCVEILCFSYDWNYLPRTVYPSNVHVNRVFIPRKLKNLLFACQNVIPFYRLFWKFHIRHFVRKYSIDVLHVHDLYMSLPARQAIDSLDVKLIVDLHENFPEAIKGYKWANGKLSSLLVRPSLWKKLEYGYLLAADWVIVLSEAFKEELTQKYNTLNKSRFIVYPNVPDVNSLIQFPINDNYHSATQQPIVFYFGAIAERRGVFTAMSAVEILTKRGVDVLLLLVGPVDHSERSRFEQAINSESLKCHIKHYEWKDISEFPSMVHASQICISPLLKNKQHESGIANKVFQYMLFAKPIVVSDCGPQADLVLEHKCGLVFKNDDAIDLADRLMEILLDKQMAQEMGEHGRNCIMKDYNIEHYGEVLSKVYNGILSDAYDGVATC